MKKLLVFFFTLFVANMLLAQTQQEQIKDDTHFNSKAKFRVYGYDGSAATTSQHILCSKTKFKVIRSLSNNTQIAVEIKRIKKNADCSSIGVVSTSVVVGQSYVINYVDLANVKRPFVGLNVGPLIVPSKLQPSSSKVYAGGQLGLYFGPKFNISSSTYVSLINSFGFGNIPINNTASTTQPQPQDTKSVLGSYYAFGIMVNLLDNVNVGIIGGWDYFNIDNTQNSRDWISFTITSPLFTSK